MRPIPVAVFATLVCLPAGADAHPLPLVAQPTTPETDPPGPGDAAAAPPGGQPSVDYSPTSSKAPDSTEQPEPGPAPEPVPEPEGPEQETVADLGVPVTEEPSIEQQEVTLQEERQKVQDQQGQFNQHGVGARGGITVIPTWLLNSFLSAHGNALCKGETVGNFANDRGLLKQDGCNFYAGAEYIYRKSRIFDIVASVGYQHAQAPDSYWLDNSEWDPDSCDVHDGDQCNLAAADYTEIDLGLIYFEADFIARAPVVLTNDIELGIGGGGGIGLGIVLGGVHQTAIGSAPAGSGTDNLLNNTCQRLADLGDFTKCTPRWDPTEVTNDPDFVFDPNDIDPNRWGANPLDFASCTKDKCDSSDLKSFGYRKTQSDIPPVVPVVNLIVSVRMIVKDVFGINLQGGFNTGFYFGASMSYFFGKKGGGTGGPAKNTPTESASAPAPKRSGLRF